MKRGCFEWAALAAVLGCAVSACERDARSSPREQTVAVDEGAGMPPPRGAVMLQFTGSGGTGGTGGTFGTGGGGTGGTFGTGGSGGGGSGGTFTGGTGATGGMGGAGR